MAWIYILIAGFLEIGWAIGLKYSDGFSRFWPTVGTVFSMIASICFLAVAMKTIPVGTAYAVWTGIGAAGTVLLGMILFSEPKEMVRLICIGLIILGVIGLKMVSPE